MAVKPLALLHRMRDALIPRVSTAVGVWWLRSMGIEIDRTARLYGLPIATCTQGSVIRVGRHVVLCSHPRFTSLGVSRPVILRTIRPGAEIDIGAETGLSGTVICAAVSVRIGEECLFGADVQIMDTDFHALAPDKRRYNVNPTEIASGPVNIGRNVFVGARSTILKGVTIGSDSVIGAGSVVVSDIPAGVIACGNPARVVKALARDSFRRPAAVAEFAGLAARSTFR